MKFSKIILLIGVLILICLLVFDIFDYYYKLINTGFYQFDDLSFSGLLSSLLCIFILKQEENKYFTEISSTLANKVMPIIFSTIIIIELIMLEIYLYSIIIFGGYTFFEVVKSCLYILLMGILTFLLLKKGVKSK